MDFGWQGLAGLGLRTFGPTAYVDSFSFSLHTNTLHSASSPHLLPYIQTLCRILLSIFAAVCNQTHARPSLLLSLKPSLRPTSVARCSKPQLLASRRTSANLTNARSTSGCDDTHAAAAQNGRKRVLLILLPIATRRRTTAPRAVKLARPSPCK